MINVVPPGVARRNRILLPATRTEALGFLTAVTSLVVPAAAPACHVGLT